MKNFQSALLISCLMISASLKLFAQENKEIEQEIITDTAFWSIFKCTPDLKDSLHDGYLDFYFQLKVIKRNLLTGKTRYLGYPVILTENSWIRQNYKTPRTKKYLRTVIELADLYSLKFADYFNMNWRFVDKEDLVEKNKEYKELFHKQLYNFDKDSNYGRDESKVEKWFFDIQEIKVPFKSNNR